MYIEVLFIWSYISGAAFFMMMWKVNHQPSFTLMGAMVDENSYGDAIYVHHF